jgi:integrase
VVPVIVPTFGAVAEEYIKAREIEWRDRRLGLTWRQVLNDHAKSLMTMPVDRINEQSVLGILKPLWAPRHKLAKKLQGYIAAILAAAKASGHRTGDNPVAWRGHLEHAGLAAPAEAKEVIGYDAMPYEDVPALMAELRATDDIKGHALEFLILTALRAGEVLAGERASGMLWSEVDFEGRAWTVPASRMKMKVEHRVPLSDRAVAILTDMEKVRTEDRVFAITGATVRRWLQGELRPKSGITLHGFRSAFRDWATLSRVDHDIAERCLAHHKGSKTEKAYMRTDMLELRRPVMQQWTEFCDGRLAAPVSNVVAITEAA